jgi:predicted enzyme related to lactoylglutathione lyase
MEKVLGIGGFFFRAEDPDTLALWYQQHLGINVVPTDYNTPPWQQAAGDTVFAPFDKANDMFGRPEQQWMMNFRVRNLEAMVAQLRASGIDVSVDEEVYPNGHFAQLHDPEGNPIQLWQPAGPDSP